METVYLKATVKRQAKDIASQKAEIRRLKQALRALVSDHEVTRADANELDSGISQTDDIRHVSEDPEREEEDEEKASENSDAMDTDASETPEALFDGEFYRCVGCGFEIVEGECAACGKIHSHTEPQDLIEGEWSIGTATDAIHSDRSLVPRGTTPLLEYYPDVEEIPPSEYLPLQTPPRRPSRIDEYHQLRRRGATRLMCETFRLSFSYEEGIYAWADTQLFEEFGGPRMKVGDMWKIHLGRRIELAEDDLDGSEFVEGLLEDAVYFPLRHSFSRRGFEIWETNEEERGIWVTKMKASRPASQERFDHDEGEERWFADGNSDAEDEEFYDAIAANENRLMETPEESDGPLRANNYETDEDEEEADLMVNYPGLTRHDSVWAGCEELREGGQSEVDPSASQTIGDDDDEAEPGGMDVSSSDSFESDFDSQEELSGDEVVGRHI